MSCRRRALSLVVARCGARSRSPTWEAPEDESVGLAAVTTTGLSVCDARFSSSGRDRAGGESTELEGGVTTASPGVVTCENASSGMAARSGAASKLTRNLLIAAAGKMGSTLVTSPKAVGSGLRAVLERRPQALACLAPSAGSESHQAQTGHHHGVGLRLGNRRGDCLGHGISTHRPDRSIPRHRRPRHAG